MRRQHRQHGVLRVHRDAHACGGASSPSRTAEDAPAPSSSTRPWPALLPGRRPARQADPARRPRRPPARGGRRRADGKYRNYFGERPSPTFTSPTQHYRSDYTLVVRTDADPAGSWRRFARGGRARSERARLRREDRWRHFCGAASYLGARFRRRCSRSSACSGSCWPPSASTA